MTQISIHDDLRSTSWGAIFAGTATVIAVFFTLSLLATSLGLGMVDAQSGSPLEGVGTTFGISAAITLLLSLVAGGFVAGRLAGTSGFTHGFLTWAVSLILAVLFGMVTISGAARTSVSALGSVASGAGAVAGATGNAAGSAVSSIAGAVDEDLIGNFDISQTRNDLRTTLRNTQIDALQPERLEPVIAAARDDVAAAAREIAFNPGDFSRIAQELGERLKERADSVAGDIDRNEIVTALTNTGMTQPEAEQAADRAIATYSNARDAITERINNANELIEKGRQRLAALEEEARRQADAAASAASAAALWAFVAALVGALAASLAGLGGARSRDRYHFE
ncbi:TIGR04086 family membrane protein [Rhizobiaceae bacterium BDR2-2]|uniref:TIGR04086 family membrane protein n=1 Tax=Ectorhizobium quercum TaxID=2965071 RepID=A0AAE3N521_9HYPH|nr:TIGR04086 family membrane protein [Ectorhizobium quercum]MCX8996289.1 TIGR04086 family membrane protein [Ectorhizobium quercum]MCX8998672.1 TIGR04086 family membrane protein [Ectorhizobium quercum]